MLDPLTRPLKDRILDPVARTAARWATPDLVTCASLAAGAVAAVFAWHGNWITALLAWLANRVLDGLDGSVARVSGRQSDFGGYLDIVVDFVVYAILPLAIAAHAGNTRLWIAASIMLASFYVNAASWMYLSALLEKRGAGARARGEETSVTMPEGLIGGTETTVLYTLFLLAPGDAMPLFLLTAVLVTITLSQRVAWGARFL